MIEAIELIDYCAVTVVCSISELLIALACRYLV